MKNLINYISESFQELRGNVTWLTWADTQRYTVIVAVFSLLLSLAIWGIDIFFTKAISGIYNILN